MLKITYKHDPYVGKGFRPAVRISEETSEWTVGEPAPSLTLENAVVSKIEATGDELNHIIENFGGIRFYRNGTTWVGEEARFIFQHLGLRST